jgi:antirestriction protein ArdC
MDVKQVITDKIISLLERGAKEGQARWSGSAKGGLPINGKTGDAYRGVNVLLLWAEAADRGYGSNVWMTYKQAEGLGGQVRKGEKAVMCAYFERVTSKRSSTETTDDETGGNSYFMCKPFWVFNVQQIDGLPAGLSDSGATLGSFEPIAQAEHMLVTSGATIRHGFDGAFYSSSKDEICLPNRERFTSPENYYATVSHELIHWTGHSERNARTFGKRFGDDAYAFEELVAELGAAYLVCHLGFVDATIENHTSYLDTWLEVLRRDKCAIFTAARHAGEAFDLILSKTELVAV